MKKTCIFMLLFVLFFQFSPALVCFAEAPPSEVTEIRLEEEPPTEAFWEYEYVGEIIAPEMVVLKEFVAQYTNTELASEITELIYTYSLAYGVDPLIVAAMAFRESNFHPSIRGGSGEYGMMQIMPGTGQWIAKKLKVENFAPSDMFDLEMNIEFAIYYLSVTTREFKSTWKGVLAYNAGSNGARKYLKTNNLYEHRYVKKVKKTYDELADALEKQKAKGVTVWDENSGTCLVVTLPENSSMRTPSESPLVLHSHYLFLPVSSHPDSLTSTLLMGNPLAGAENQTSLQPFTVWELPLNWIQGMNYSIPMHYALNNNSFGTGEG